MPRKKDNNNTKKLIENTILTLKTLTKVEDKEILECTLSSLIEMLEEHIKE